MNFNRIEEVIYDQFSILRKEKKVLILDVTDTYFREAKLNGKLEEERMVNMIS
ncbi:MAG: hypothetical protein IPL98_04620 [Saprospiraceae bacterium]|nr:hypothetical protein [Saprospiraceae bacterium]